MRLYHYIGGNLLLCPKPVTFILNSTTGIQGYQTNFKFNIFPNPAKDFLYFEVGERPVRPPDANSLPKKFSLSQNYPNPFNPVTNIKFDLPFEDDVKILLYDVMGKQVMIVSEGLKRAGSYIVSINAAELSTGIYFCKMETSSGFSKVIRLMLIK